MQHGPQATTPNGARAGGETIGRAPLVFGTEVMRTGSPCHRAPNSRRSCFCLGVPPSRVSKPSSKSFFSESQMLLRPVTKLGPNLRANPPPVFRRKTGSGDWPVQNWLGGHDIENID